MNTTDRCGTLPNSTTLEFQSFVTFYSLALKPEPGVHIIYHQDRSRYSPAAMIPILSNALMPGQQISQSTTQILMLSQ